MFIPPPPSLAPSKPTSNSTPPPPSLVPSNTLIPKNSAGHWRNKPKVTEEKINFSEAVAHPINDRIDWSKIRNVALSSNPTAAVFFVETDQPNQLVVVKSTMTLVGEIFGSKLAQRLGLFAPDMRLVEFAPHVENQFDEELTSEWQDMKHFMSDKALKKNEHGVSMRVDKELNRAFFLVMEYAEGAVSLEDLMQHEELAKQLLTNESILLDIGRMVVLDIILNNCDRLPVENLWDHEGNASNILFSTKRNKLVCIDQTLFAIDAANEKDYLDKVAKFAKGIEDNQLAEDDPYINHMCAYMESVTGLRIEACHKQTIRDGILNAIKAISSENFSLFSLYELKSQIDSMKTGLDWADVWKISMEKVNLSFLTQVISQLTNK